MQPFLGCIKNLKVFSDFQVLQEQVGVSKGCPVESLVRLQHPDSSKCMYISVKLAFFDD